MACSFAECVLWEISDAFVDTKPRGIEVSSTVIVTGQPRVSSGSQFGQQKPWWWLANEDIVIYVQIFMNTINNKAKPQAH